MVEAKRAQQYQPQMVSKVPLQEYSNFVKLTGVCHKPEGQLF